MSTKNRNSIWAVIAAILALVADVAWAKSKPGHCISRSPQLARLSRVPVAVPGLEPLVSMPVTGKLKLHAAATDCCGTRWSPAGDHTTVAGPYDPIGQRLYLWGYSRNGWIDVEPASETWALGESGTIDPKLYSPSDDIEDVTLVERSGVLGVQFYSGYTAPHWLTGSQSYRVYQINGADMSRLTELETRVVSYLGDDLETGLAVFGPAEGGWGKNPELLVWYDGTGILIPNAEFSRPTGWCP